MPKTISARVLNGRIEPSEPLELREGSDLLVTATRTKVFDDGDPTLATAGAWRELIDCEALEHDRVASRRIQTH